MSDPGGITVIPRTIEELGSGHKDDIGLAPQSNLERKPSRNRRNQDGPQDPAQIGQGAEEKGKEEENVGKGNKQEVEEKKQGWLLTDQEGHRTQFYKQYREVAGVYDKEFIKIHDDDLTTTLIFAGLFSAVTSAFIIEVDSQLQPDPGDETVALLRLLIYKIDNTTFGNDVPTIPQWTGPPRRLIYVQAILFASLAASLFSSFLAVLGKQWLNRYELKGIRGSDIERDQERQRKLDGVEAWYFDAVMESLPLMLQAALLLLGCALSLYLWGIDTTIASVVLGITSFGLTFYLFIIIAGVTTESCPYQTPASQFICYLGRNFGNVLAAAFRETLRAVRNNVEAYHPWSSRVTLKDFLRNLVSEVPPAVAIDARRLWRVVKAIVVIPARLFRAHNRTDDTYPTQESRSTPQTAVLDVRCISWTLHTSFNNDVRTSALKHLTSVLGLAKFDPGLVVDCFNIFVGAISVNERWEGIIPPGLEELAPLSATCFYRAFHRLAVVDPTSKVLKHIRRRYLEDFPYFADFSGLSPYHTITMIDTLVREDRSPPFWFTSDDWASEDNHILFAQDISELARAEYQHQQKVPDWILGFSFQSLSQYTLPPESAVAHCLMVSAIHLGCNVSEIATMEESMKLKEVLTHITQKLETMVEDGDQTLADCFSVSAVCISVSNRRDEITEGLEQLATVFTERLYHTLHRLMVTTPTSSVLKDIRQSYRKIFPYGINLTDLSSRNTSTMVDALIGEDCSGMIRLGGNDRSPNRDHNRFVQDIVELAQAEYRRQKKVPGWILSFSLESLSRDPFPPASVVADCLKISAIHLGCSVLGVATLDESATVKEFLTLITRKLETMVEAGNQTLVDCFSISTVCISVSNRREEITQGLEQLAMAFTERFYHTLYHLTVTDPTSSVLGDMRQRHDEVFPCFNGFTGLPSRHTIAIIFILTRTYSYWINHDIWGDDDRPSDDKHIQFARDIVQLAQVTYQQKQEVPTWTLNFALGSLSMDPLPPASVVADCLKLSATQLGCDVSDVAALDESTRAKEFLALITRKLETMVEAGNQTLADCFSISTVCSGVSNRREESTEGLEQLATTLTERFYRTLHHLTVTDPTSIVLGDMRQRYDGVFPRRINFTGFPSCHTITMIDALAREYWSNRRAIWRNDDRPSDDEHVGFARDTAEVSQAKYQQERGVPTWALHFALDSMFLDPLPPALIVADCLKVIAIALGCDVSDIATSDESVQVVLDSITQDLETVIRADQDTITSKSKAVCALIPYAIFLEKRDQQGMANMITRVVRASRDCGFLFPIQPHITTLFGQRDSPFRNWLLTLMGHFVGWKDEGRGEDAVVAWAAAVSTVPDTEEVTRSVVGTLMQIANIDSLRAHIPVETWAWMKKWQSLPVADWGQFSGATQDAICYVRELEDFEIIGSYVLLVCSDWYGTPTDTFDEVEISIRGVFGRIGMQDHREGLLKQLEYILEMMDAEMMRDGGVDYRRGLKRCRKLQDMLQDMDREATETLVRSHSAFVCALPLHCL